MIIQEVIPYPSTFVLNYNWILKKIVTLPRNTCHLVTDFLALGVFAFSNQINPFAGCFDQWICVKVDTPLFMGRFTFIVNMTYEHGG